jgi:polygalacturonase
LKDGYNYKKKYVKIYFEGDDMYKKLVLIWFAVICFILTVKSFAGESFYTTRLEDPQAVYLTKDAFPAINADGIGDDTDVLQQAITSSAGNVLFIPEGKYRISNTISVRSGTRLIGYGAKRPVFILGENTPGFQDERTNKYMFTYAAGAGSFYCAVSNIDIEIGPGNPAAVGIQFHIAQHSYIAHMDIRIGTARAGLIDIGNEIDDVHFYGGQYGMICGRAAPGWPILAIDCTFEGQGKAALSLQKSGLAFVRPQFKNVPAVAEILPDQFDELWMSDGRFEDVSGPAIIINSNENNPCNQINMENIICKNVPVLVSFPTSKKTIQGKGQQYVVEKFSHGLQIESPGAKQGIETTFVANSVNSLPAAVKTDIPRLPTCDTWVNVSTLGVVGDGKTDNTAALKEAIAKHRTLYFPTGLYNISDTLVLRPDTVLIALHPSMTVINLPDNTPAFQGDGEPKSIIESPKGGTNIVTGIGVYGGAVNPRAVGVKWMAGADSMMNDVRIHGGHGTTLQTGGRNWRQSQDTWSSQPAGLWITNGGGGTFKDIWTPNVFAKSGMLITDTSTSGRVYAMSLEHHVKNEMILRNVSNWKFFAAQFEEEREEGPEALPLEIEKSSNILFVNSFFYRVISTFIPYPYAIKTTDSRDIRFRNMHLYSNSRVSFDSTLYDTNAGVEVREPEFAVLDITGTAVSRPRTGTAILESGAKVEKLADGFLNVAGAAVNSKGEFYFADARFDPRKADIRMQRIYRWSPQAGKAEVVREIPEQPMVLAFDKSDNLMVVCYNGNGTILSIKPDAKDSNIVSLTSQPAQPQPGKIAFLPINRWTWTTEPAFIRTETVPKTIQYMSPDGTAYIPANQAFVTGASSWGVKMADMIRAFRIAPAIPGHQFYVTNEADLKTIAFNVEPDGSLSNGKLFIEDGGESIDVDEKGNVYLAAGNIKVFDSSGKQIDTIEVPQRPTSIVFGGTDKKTLFMTARSSIYSVRTKFAGR